MKDIPQGVNTADHQEGTFPTLPLHILFLARWYPNRFDPMLGLFVRNHALMASSFATVSVVYVQPVNSNLHKTTIDYKDDQGIRTWCVYYPASSLQLPLIGNIWKGILYLRANIKGIRHAIRQTGKPSLIHVHVLTRAGIPALLLRRRYRLPLVITEHWSRYLPAVNTFRGAIRKWLTRFIVKRAAAVTTPTKNLQDAMKNFGLLNPHYSILPNLVDTERFVPAWNKKDNAQRKIQFVHVSCFEDRSKNISGLLRVISILATKRNDFQCRMVGVGEDFDRLRKQAMDSGILDHYVVFTGLLEGDQLVQAINTADFMVIPSHFENLPVVIGEAFSCGIPVLSTDVGGISEIITRENGHMIKAHDDQSLADGIEYMLDHHKEYDANVIRKCAEQHFSKQAIVFALKSLYLNALKKKHG
ncbi:MAG: glycosyltransferase [Bacteroidales bacterium]|nr:glycosyltransferase [Lentimicrobiaceae bacterium]MDD5695379.1 glycosyltransferase [Bacteroidales bacterium]